MIGKKATELKIGDSAHFTKTVSEADIYLFAGVTGGMNPMPGPGTIYMKQTLFFRAPVL